MHKVYYSLEKAADLYCQMLLHNKVKMKATKALLFNKTAKPIVMTALHDVEAEAEL